MIYIVTYRGLIYIKHFLANKVYDFFSIERNFDNLTSW